MANTAMNDLSNILGTQAPIKQAQNSTNKKAGSSLDMTDFLTLMVAMFQNQDIDNAASTTDMMNQMVQMQMITSMVNMTDAVTMNYAASLVGKEVTVGKLGDDGKLQEVVGVVTGTGTMDGQQVIFVNDEYYYLNEIMAVGKLPPPHEDDEEDGDKVEDAGKPGGTQKPEDTKKPEGTETPEDTKKPEGTETPSEPVQPGDGTQSAEYDGKDGAPTGSEG